MRSIIISLALLIILVAVGCNKQKTTSSSQPPIPVEIEVVGDFDENNYRMLSLTDKSPLPRHDVGTLTLWGGEGLVERLVERLEVRG